jgi:phosphoglucan,water dikinase
MISLVATPEKVEWESSMEPSPAQNRDRGHSVRVPEARLTSDRTWISLEQVVPETGGGKAAGARRLAELADQSGFKTPPALVVPFGVMEAALRAVPESLAEYRELLGRISGMGDFTTATERLSDLIQHLNVPDELVSAVSKKFDRNIRLIARSSANCEDLEELAGAGLYESLANVAPSDVASAIRAVWSSLWTRRAALSRQQANIPHEQAHIAVLIQEMLTPDFSFVLHTVNPINHKPGEVYAELAVGLGETVASAATRGNPYRMICDKHSGSATTLAFANFSHALWPDPAGGVSPKIVDYSHIAMSCDADARKRMGRRLASIARLVEGAFEKPQDIEGAVVGEEIYLVQARPQQGLQTSNTQRPLLNPEA